jgi:hypothetical protein
MFSPIDDAAAVMAAGLPRRLGMPGGGRIKESLTDEGGAQDWLR